MATSWKFKIDPLPSNGKLLGHKIKKLTRVTGKVEEEIVEPEA